MRIALITALILAAVPAFAEVPTVKADKSFVGIGFKVDTAGAKGTGSIEIYAAPRQVGDKLAICGFVFVDSTSSTTKTVEKRFTSLVQFRLGGKSVQVATSLFKRYYSKADLASPLAGCAVTQQAWDPSFAKAAFTLDLAPSTVYD